MLHLVLDKGEAGQSFLQVELFEYSNIFLKSQVIDFVGVDRSGIQNPPPSIDVPRCRLLTRRKERIKSLFD